MQTHYRHESGIASSKGRQERLKLVKSFERAWAIACGLASRDPSIGQEAIEASRDSLRQSAARNALWREKYIQTGSFNLLSNQVRYGGIGIYSTFLEECHLASMQSFTLRPLGEALADAFPSPAGMPVHDEDARLSLEALREWGACSHRSLYAQEGAMLAEALRGGEEADHPDHVRWAALRMLGSRTRSPAMTKGNYSAVWQANEERNIRQTRGSVGLPDSDRRDAPGTRTVRAVLPRRALPLRANSGCRLR